MREKANSAAALIVGRKVSDYRACGERVPLDLVVLECFVCCEKIAMSAEAYGKIEDFAADPETLVLALCGTCALDLMPPGSRIEMTKHGADRIKESEVAKDTLSKMIRKSAGEA